MTPDKVLLDFSPYSRAFLPIAYSLGLFDCDYLRDGSDKNAIN